MAAGLVSAAGVEVGAADVEVGEVGAFCDVSREGAVDKAVGLAGALFPPPQAAAARAPANAIPTSSLFRFMLHPVNAL